jgi:RimJ/RimL family protein N-acetyltransferase
MATPSKTLGDVVDVSQPCTPPERIIIDGTYVNLVPMQASHTEEIWPLLESPHNDSIWKWWLAGPYPNIKAYEDHISELYDKTDPLFWAIVESKSGKCQGYAILGEVDLKNRVIEAGMFVTLALQRTTAATEAFYLIGRYAFSLGFRRLVWRTNSFNLPSRRAAERYGFSMSNDRMFGCLFC